MNTLREECNENMIFAYCTQCKKSFTEKIKFCPHCGYKLENLFQEAVGQFSIGMIALKAADCASAAFWFMEAAKQQYGDAQYELGLLYQAGNGVEKNNKRAEYCFQRAYANGCRQGHLADAEPISEIDDLIDEDNMVDVYTLNKTHNLRGKKGNIVKGTFMKPSLKTVDILAEETIHLKNTVEIIGEVIEQKQDTLYRPVLADVQDKIDRLQYIADYEEMCTVESTIAELQDCLVDPYFGHMNLLCVGSSEFMDMYVGKKAICFNGEFLVHSCWSPIGNKIYDTINTKYSHEEYEYMLQFRRKMQCLNGSLINCVEDYNRDSALLTDSISDAFLLQVLKEKQGAKQITNIIKTFQSNQNELIRKPLSENLIVQGCAGSGKTMILLHRLASLLYLNPKWNLDAVKIITPSENFNNHIDYLWRDLGIDSIEKLSLQQYYAHCLSGYGINIHKRKNKSAAMRYGNENELDAGLVAYFYSDVFVLKLNEVLPSYKKLLFEKNQKNDKIYKSQMKHYNDLRDSGVGWWINATKAKTSVP